MGTRKNNKKSKKSNKRFRKTRSKRQRGGNPNDDLLNAIDIDNANKIIQALEDGADVNAKDNNGRMVITWASWNGHKEIVEKLLNNGVDVNAKDNWGYTALQLASSNGHTKIVAMLLEKGADVNAKNNRSDTALISASESGHTETVANWRRELMYAKECWGNTALIQASKEDT